MSSGQGATVRGRHQATPATGGGPADDEQSPDDELDVLHRPMFGPVSLQHATLLVAVVFLVVGILGFIPGATTHLSFQTGPRFSGAHSHAMLFGLFMVSVLHNFVHLGYAVIGAVASFFALTARLYFFVGGAVYLALCIYGLSIDRSGPANFLPVDSADNWLHLGLGLAMIAAGVLVQVRVRRMASAAPSD